MNIHHFRQKRIKLCNHLKVIKFILLIKKLTKKEDRKRIILHLEETKIDHSKR